jgi:surface carbohydrate biosynthesis protein
MITREPEMTTVIYLLIEESFRELASRQVIAADCLGRGFEVIIAQQWWFHENLPWLPAGIVLFKGNNRPQGALMKLAKSHGHIVTTIEEEAFGTTYAPEIRGLYDATSIEVADVFFVQGAIHRDLLLDWFPQSKGRISVVGNPRTDVLLHAQGSQVPDKASKLHEEHGDFLLVNTNSAGVNPFDIDTYSYFQRCVEVGVIDPDDPEDMNRFDTLMAWDLSNLIEMSRFVREMAARRKDLPIILRPHPSENHRTWQTCFEEISNVHIVLDRDHVAWILAARAMVHSGCTTGLESSLLGTPAIGICPGRHPWHDGFISNQASDISETSAEAVQRTMEILATHHEIDEEQSRSLLNKLKPSLEIEHDRRSSRRMADVFTDLQSSATLAAADHRWDRSRGNTLSGRRQEKAYIGLEAFRESWMSTTAALGRAENARVTEIAPAVFHLALAA